MIKTLLFDNDGILVDTESRYFMATRLVLASVGADFTPELFYDCYLIQGKGAWHLAAQQGIDDKGIKDLIVQRDVLYEQFLDRGDLVIPGVVETLTQLYGRFAMGIVTSSRRVHFERIHRRSGLLDFFDFVLTSEDVTNLKPHPEPYLLGAQRAGAAPEACVVIEDTPRGLTAALNAGMRCIIIPNELSRANPFAGAHARLESIYELPELLETWNQEED